MYLLLQRAAAVTALLSLAAAGPIPSQADSIAKRAPLLCTMTEDGLLDCPPDSAKRDIISVEEKRTACIGGKCTIPPAEKREPRICTLDDLNCPNDVAKREAEPLRKDRPCEETGNCSPPTDGYKKKRMEAADGAHCTDDGCTKGNGGHHKRETAPSGDNYPPNIPPVSTKREAALCSGDHCPDNVPIPGQ